MDKIFIEQQNKRNEGQDPLLPPEPTVADLIVTVAELSDRLKRVESALEILKPSPTKDSAGTTATRDVIRIHTSEVEADHNTIPVVTTEHRYLVLAADSSAEESGSESGENEREQS